MFQSGFLDRLGSPFYGVPVRASHPRATDFDLDVFEKDDQLIIRAGLAGCEPSDVSVSTEGRTLKIFADRKSLDTSPAIERSPSGTNSCDVKPVVNDRLMCQLERHIQIGRTYDLDTITASLKHGLLTVLVKKAAIDEERKIPVATS